MAKRISLEDYLDLLQSPHDSNFTINFLNQIIFMHGFRKLHGTPKRIVTDAVDALDLVDPSRSTLKSTISPGTPLTLGDSVADLNALNWQECCVTSIQTLNLPPAQATEPPAQKRNQRGKSKQKTRALETSVAGGPSSSSALMSLGS